MSTMNEIKIIGLKEIPLIKEGDDIAKIILEAIKKNNLGLQNGDIFVIAQTIITKSNGRIKNLKKVRPSSRAIEIHKKILSKAINFDHPVKSPELIQLILEESNEILKIEHVLIAETKHGFICANAGIDKSNIEGKENVGLLPNNPDEDAKKIRANLKKFTNKNVAIIISDSFGRPFRIGAVGVALGVSGINPILDKRGKKDLFNYQLQSTVIGHVDSLASAAQLVMGEANEGIPIILIRGYDFELQENVSIKSILRDKKIDLFRTNTEDFKKILKGRRSYKFNFDSKKVDKNIIEECIEVARWAPSAHNGQHWRYIILYKGSLRERLINKMNEKLRFDLKKEGRSDSFIRRKINKTRKNFLEAPVLILLCLDSRDLEKYSDEERSQNEFILGVQSISCSAVYLLIAFEIKKLAACWYCAPLFTKQIIRKVLKLPESYIPMAFFTVGYPLKPVKVTPRKSLEDIIFKLRE